MWKCTLLSLLAAQHVIQAQFTTLLDAQAQGRRCCQALAKTPLNVYYANTPRYQERVEHIWSLGAALPPACFVLPERTEQVSQIIQTLTSLECSFGVVSGGHSDWPGANSVESGVTIDFGYLNTTTYDPDTKLVSIRPGATWQSVYEVLHPQGVTVAGGRAGGVGVGGFVTGGGNSFFSTSHGWACDNVQAFQVVLANGSIVDAHADGENLLWQALKGGSGNLGLVTRFDMYVIDFPDPTTPNIWGGVAEYDLGAAEAVVDAYVDFVERNHEDKNTSTMLTWVYDYSENQMTLNVAMENTINIEWPPIFDGYVNVSGMTSNTMSSGPITNITAMYGAIQPAGYSQVWITGSYKNDARIITYAAERHDQLIADDLASAITNDSALVSLCCFFPLTQAMIEHGAERGGNAMGLEEVSNGENGSIFLISLSFSPGGDNEEKALAAARRLVDDIDAHATSLGLNWGWRFLNYAYGYQDPIASYGSSSQNKIRGAADRYDPDKVFQRLRRTGHKIPAE